MIDKIKKFFSKNEKDFEMHLPANENAIFILKVDDIDVGYLSCNNGEWVFKYSEKFKNDYGDYNLIKGFPDVNREYRSEVLWPFFRIRIPGLKQPAIKEILEKEGIDEQNEFELLKRFGKKTISNPYKLLFGKKLSGVS